jgi:hypothetical protein
MPMDVISTMLGVPAADRDRVRHLTNAGMHREGGLGIPASALAAQAEVSAYYVEFIKDRQAHPGDDLLSDLIAAEIPREDGSLTKLSFEELLGFCLLLGNAGHETTARLDLQQRRDAGAQSRPAPRARERAAKSHGQRRRGDAALRPAVAGAGPLDDAPVDAPTVSPSPQTCACSLLTGARAPRRAAVPDPDRFDIHRKLDRTVHFGQGHHLCLGKSLARQECRVAFEEILARFPNYQVDEANLEWARNNNVRGYSKVPMRTSRSARRSYSTSVQLPGAVCAPSRSTPTSRLSTSGMIRRPDTYALMGDARNTADVRTVSVCDALAAGAGMYAAANALLLLGRWAGVHFAGIDRPGEVAGAATSRRQPSRRARSR